MNCKTSIKFLDDSHNKLSNLIPTDLPINSYRC